MTLREKRLGTGFGVQWHARYVTPTRRLRR